MGSQEARGLAGEGGSYSGGISDMVVLPLPVFDGASWTLDYITIHVQQYGWLSCCSSCYYANRLPSHVARYVDCLCVRNTLPSTSCRFSLYLYLTHHLS